jgi:glycosyltransferase involved in cell wall biosynthesis
MSDNPLISVVIPVWNCAQYVAQAIESVLAQLYQPVELVVVDDGSTDGSAAVIERYTPAVRYHYQANAGLSAARNTGIRLSAGSYVAFLDSDDLWLPAKLDRQMTHMRADPAPDLVFGHVQQFVSPELDVATRSRLEGDGKILAGVFAGSLLVHRDVFDKIGLFDGQWRVGEFIDWYLRTREAGLEAAMIPEIVTRRRLHTANMTIRERAGHADYARIIKASLARRRKSGSASGGEPHGSPGA